MALAGQLSSLYVIYIFDHKPDAVFDILRLC